MRTWRNLYSLLKAADVDRRHCFFTNAYVGLVAGQKAVGRFPGADSPQFVAWCRDFLLYQIAVMRPSALITLGADARRFVGELSTDLGAWRARRADPIVNRARIEGHQLVAVALAHPSMYPVSAASRRFDGQRGMAAEVALLRAAGRSVS